MFLTELMTEILEMPVINIIPSAMMPESEC